MSDERIEAAESEGVLRCYLDQLPPQRCIVCAGDATGTPRDRLPMCSKCTPRVALPIGLGVLVAGSSIVYGFLHGFAAAEIAQIVFGLVLGAACVGVAVFRSKLRRVIAPTERLALRNVPDDVARAVLELGAGPHPARALVAG